MSKSKRYAPQVKIVQPSEPKTIESANVLSEEGARELVEKEYLTPLHVEYIVLENGHVFYGLHRSEAIRIAKENELNYFDIKF